MCNKQENIEIVNKSNDFPYKHCLNCGTELNGMYCHVCGQQATSKTPTVRGFVLEYFNNAFIWDSQFLKTIWDLVSRPGFLTKDYLSGKFISQEHPLKLNMFLLFVIITLLALFAGTEKINDSVQNLTNDERVFPNLQIGLLLQDSEYAKKMNESPRDTIQLYASLLLAKDYPEIISSIEITEDTQGQALDKWTAVLPHVLIEDKIIVPHPDGYYRFNVETEVKSKKLEIVYNVWEKMVDLTNRYFPILVLFTAPLLSFSLRFVQRKNKLPKINHFIFALHYTALLEMLMICIYLLHLIIAPPIWLLEYIMMIGSSAYLTIAFRRVYGSQSWFKAILKALFTNLVYSFICLTIFVVIFLIACFIVAV